MTKVILILLTGLCFEAVGVVNLSRGLKQVGGPGHPGVQFSASGLLRLAKSVITNRNVVLGVACQAVYFGALCYLLTQREVSLVWPVSSLSFVFTALAARLVLREEVSALRWTGILFVVLGAAIVTWSEKIREREAASRAATTEAHP